MEYSPFALSNVSGMPRGHKTTVKGKKSKHYALASKILAFLLTFNSALGYTEFGGTIRAAIPDPGTLAHTVNVEAGSCDAVADIDVILAYDHTYSADLIITLKAPDGDVATLISGKGGGNDPNHNYPITFNDESSNPITSFDQYWADPRITEFQSEGTTLSALYGKDATGDWILSINDKDVKDSGELWSVVLRMDCKMKVCFVFIPFVQPFQHTICGLMLIACSHRASPQCQDLQAARCVCQFFCFTLIYYRLIP